MKKFNKTISIILSIILLISSLLSYSSVKSYCWIDEWEIPTSEGEGLGYKYALNEAITHDALSLIAAFAIGDGSASGHMVLDALRSAIGTFGGRYYNKYNYKKTVQIFCDNQWPYDLQKTEDMDYPLVGHVLANDENYEKAKELLKGNYKGGQPIEVLDSFKDEAYNPEYDDINYAEILTIMSDNNQFSYMNVNLLDFSDRLLREENRKYYYELKLRWVAVMGVHVDADNDGFEEIYTRESEEFASFEEMLDFVNAILDDGEEFLIHTPVGELQADDLDEFYINSYLKPFGLRDIWALAIQTDDELRGKVSIDEFAFYMDNMYYQSNVTDVHITNMELLDDQEAWMRVMTRFDKGSIIDHREDAPDYYKQDIFGPSFNEERSELSTIYEDLLNDEDIMEKYGMPTGRSLWEFFPWEDCYNLKDEPKSLMEDGDFFFPASDFWGMTEEEFAAFIASLPPEAVMNGYQYINQALGGQGKNLARGDASWGKSFQGSGCCDSSYMMIVAAFFGITLSNQDIVNIASNTRYYSRGSNGSVLFRGDVFLADMSQKYGNGQRIVQTGGGNRTYDPRAIQAELDKGNPVIFHIRGHWEDPHTGRVYHYSDGGHFLTIAGYDNKGFYVNDPGSSANTTNGPIPYEAFGNYGVYDMYFRSFELQ